MSKGLYGYKCFYGGRTHEVYADSLWAAKQQAVAYFKPRKRQEHMVSVVCCQRPDGSTVTHSTASFG